MRCAARGADELSLFALGQELGVMPDNFATRAFFGNDASTISDAITGPGRGQSILSVFITNTAMTILPELVKAQADVAVWGFNKTSGADEIKFWGKSGVDNASSRALGTGLKVLSKGKALLDYPVYLGALGACYFDF